MRTSCGRAVPPTMEMNVGAPFSTAKPASIQLVRTDISRPYTRYEMVTVRAPPVVTRQRFFADFTMVVVAAAGAARHDILDVALVFAHQVGARRPDRHEQLDLRLSAGRIRGFDLDVVRLRRGEAERVADGLDASAPRAGRAGV